MIILPALWRAQILTIGLTAATDANFTGNAPIDSTNSISGINLTLLKRSGITQMQLINLKYSFFINVSKKLPINIY